MSLSKKEIIDLIEILENNRIQVRTATRIYDDNLEISSSFNRNCIEPGDDYSAEDPKVQAICSVIHTQEVIDAYKAGLQSDIISQPES